MERRYDERHFVFFKLYPNFGRKNEHFHRHRYPAHMYFHEVKCGGRNFGVVPCSPWHAFSCAVSLISGLLIFLYLIPKHNPNPKENSKMGLIVRLRCPARGWCRLSPIRATPRFMAAVTELPVLLLLQHGHALAIFREEREGHISLLYLRHCSIFFIALLVWDFLSDLVEMRLAIEPGSSSSFVAVFFFILLLLIRRGYYLW